MRRLLGLFLTGLLMITFVYEHGLAFDLGAKDPTAVEASIALQGTTVRYVGKINDLNVERLMAIVNGKTVTELIISSGGGEINAGMTLGEWVFDHEIDVVVEQMCMSSCANYVFTAGRRKKIEDNAVVAWHGSILQEMSEEDIRAATIMGYEELPETAQAKIDLETLIEQSIQQMQDYETTSKAKQAEFFKKIGVDEYVCRIGNEDYGAEDFFCLSVGDMVRFGILNVEAPANYADTDLASWQESHSIEFIDLD